MTTITDAAAWSQSRYGGPDVLDHTDAALPPLAPGDVMISVAACSLNSADVRIMRGDPLLVRLAFGIRRPKTPVPGRDVAGRITAVGSAVTGWQVGDRVVGELSGGGLATHVVAPASRIVEIPRSVDDVTASTLPLAGGTAWQALDLGRVGAGSRVLVVGAGGGVGTFAVRLAVLRDAAVDAVCGARGVEVVRALGAQQVIDYRATDFVAAAAGHYDAVIDIAGTTPLRALQGLVRDGGVVVGVTGGTNRVFGPLGRMLRGAVLSIASRRRIRPLAATAHTEITTQLLALAAAGDLVPAVEHTWPLAEARAAVAHVDAGRTVGKVVVTA